MSDQLHLYLFVTVLILIVMQHKARPEQVHKNTEENSGGKMKKLVRHSIVKLPKMWASVAIIVIAASSIGLSVVHTERVCLNEYEELKSDEKPFAKEFIEICQESGRVTEAKYLSEARYYAYMSYINGRGNRNILDQIEMNQQDMTNEILDKLERMNLR